MDNVKLFYLLFIGYFIILNMIIIQFKIKEYKDYKLINSLSSYNHSDIPKNVYLTWYVLDLPYYMQKNLEINKRKNPEYNFYVYDDEMSYNFIKNNFDNSIANVYNKLKPGAYKADLFRYCILYINGGVYLDIKFKLHVKLVNLISKYGEIYVKDVVVNLNVCETKNPCFNGFIVSKPYNSVFLDCINQIKLNYETKYYGSSMLSPTGPCLFGSILESKKIKFNMKVLTYNNVFNNYILNYNIDYLYNSIINYIIGLRSYKITDINNNIILSQYKNYRQELLKYSKTRHYGDLWNEKDIYTE
jgi:mannosyltransferase OCH1-like enzyme